MNQNRFILWYAFSSMFYIKNTENSVWEYFQTPRREFKIRRTAEYSDEL